jgi:hypothetical protein
MTTPEVIIVEYAPADNIVRSGRNIVRRPQKDDQFNKINGIGIVSPEKI